MRIRCMKFKRKSVAVTTIVCAKGRFDKKLGLLKLLDFTATTMGKSLSVVPHSIASSDPLDGSPEARGNETGVARCGKAARR